MRRRDFVTFVAVPRPYGRSWRKSQIRPMPVIGYLSAFSEEQAAFQLAGFRPGVE